MPQWQRQPLLIIGLTLWSVIALLAAAILDNLLFWALSQLGALQVFSANTTTVLEGIVLYAIMLGILVGVPWMVLKFKPNRQLLGIDRLLRWIDIGMALSGLVLYFIVAGIVMWLVSLYIPQVDIAQAQDTGISMPFGFERIFVFLLFVVIGPIMEELLFRGYLYGVLRKNGVSFVLTTLVVSILFGAAHGQWNVGINVAILSVMMCIGREVTGSIWPGILIHMMKNGIAFYVLFVTPLLPGIQ